MKKMLRKSLAVILVVVMTITAAPLGGFVGLELPSLFNFKAEAATYSGFCGDNLKWSYNETFNRLSITGTGDMWACSSSSDVPWHVYSRSIVTIDIAEGVTSISEYAFSGTNLFNLVIPDSVTSIGDYAFYNSYIANITFGNGLKIIGDHAFEICVSLSTITIPDSVITIGDNAFASCKNVTELTIGSNVETIGNSAFNGCRKISSLIIGNSVKTIGSGAFYDCIGLKNVIIGNSVETIGVSAFEKCTALENIVISDSVKNIEDRAFNGCYNIVSIDVSENNENFSSDEFGVLFDKNKTTLFQYPAGNKSTSYTIPDSVTSIDFPAFYNCDKLISVNFGNHVETICNSAFYDCDKLESLITGDSLTAISNSAFNSCNNLKSVIIGSNVSTIGNYAFRSCEMLNSVTIGDSVKTIGDYAFENCKNLYNLKFGNSIETIGNYAFSSCSPTSISIPESVRTIGAYAFNCHHIEYMHIPTGVKAIGSKVLGDTSAYICNDDNDEYLKAYAQDNGTTFRLCEGHDGFVSGICGDNTYWSLDLATQTLSISGTGNIDFCTWVNYSYYIKTVDIQDGVTGIGYSVFSNCKSLNKVAIAGSVTYIDGAFQGIKSLKSVTFGENSKLTTIDNGAFLGCTQLVSIELPASVTTIGKTAFFGCSNLKTVAFGENSRLETIGESAFAECSRLTDIALPASIKRIGVAAFEDTAIYNNSASWTDKVLYIGNYLVDSYQSITECNVKAGTICIADGAFNRRSSLTRVTIPAGVTGIGVSAFQDCSKLTEITISDSVKYIGKDAFLNTSYMKDNNNWTDNVLYIGNNLIGAKTTLSGTYNIKEETVCIADYAFKDCTSLRGVTIPAGVTAIGDYTFYNCYYLNDITLPGDITSIGNSAFGMCQSIKNVIIPDSVVTIGEKAFEGANISQVVIPDSVEKIGHYAFYNCRITVDENNKYYSSDENGVLFNKDKTVLVFYTRGNNETSYKIPNGVTTIGPKAFSYNIFLKTITLPNTVKRIEEGAFEGCNSITSIVLPGGLTYIGALAFAYCGKLRNVTMPDSVRVIDGYSFYNCYNLSQVTIPDNVRIIGPNAFYDCAIENFDLPSNVSYIGSEAFVKNSMIESVHITESTEYIGESAFDKQFLSYICSPTQNCYAKKYADINGITFKICKGDCALLEEISIKTPASKTEYVVGDTLDITGLTLTADYSDNTSETVASGFVCSPKILKTSGVQEITIAYGDATCTFNVNVKNIEIEKLNVIALPDKTVYKVGETLETSGLTIEAIFNNGKIETLSRNLNCTPTKFETAGTYTVTVSYKDKTCNFNVEVIELTKIEIITASSRKTYFVGEKLNTAGLALKATYSDGSTETVASNFTCLPNEFSVAGTQKITVTYGDKTCAFDVKVIAVQLESIEINKLPHKMNYFVGDELDTTGLVLTAIYNNGTTETVTSGFVCSPAKLTTEGTHTITVAYSDKTCAFDVTVNAISVLLSEIVTNPIKMEYFIGEKLDTTGLALDVRYSNGKTERVTSGFTCYPDELNTAGTHTISVYYGDRYSGSFDVTVTAVKLESVDIKDMPTKLEYFVGDVLDVSGLVLTATYSNGESETVMSGFTCAPTTLDTAGTQKITVTYREKTCSYNVTVNMIELTGIEINTLPRKTEYFVGDSLDVSGLSLTVTYNNGESKVVTSGFAVQPEVLTTAGVQKITVSYGGKTAEFVVSSHILGNWETVVEATIDNDGYKVRRCSTCKKVFEETIIPRHRVLNDERSQTEVIVPGDMFEGNVELRVTDAQNDAYFEVERKSGRLIGAYDISLLVNGVETQPTGAVTVRIKVAKSIFNKNCNVYHIDPVTGAREKIPCEYKDGFVIFEADGFSYYAIIDETPEVELSLIQPSVQKIDFGDTLVLRLEEVEIPEGYAVKWFVEGAGVSTKVSDDGLECRVTSIANGNPTISAKLVDEEENVATNADGEEISDEITLTSKAGFWQKFVSFFKNLFGINRVIY